MNNTVELTIVIETKENNISFPKRRTVITYEVSHDGYVILSDAKTWDEAIAGAHGYYGAFCKYNGHVSSELYIDSK